MITLFKKKTKQKKPPTQKKKQKKKKHKARVSACVCAQKPKHPASPKDSPAKFLCDHEP